MQAPTCSMPGTKTGNRRQDTECLQRGKFLDNGAGGGTAGDGVHQPGENDLLPLSNSLSPGETVHFFLKVTVPAGATDHGASTNTLTVKNQDGSGAQDNWPAANGRDSQSDQTTTTCVVAPGVTVDSVIPAVVSTGAAAVVSWTANKDADYFIEVGGSGVKGSGVLLTSGTCQAGVQVQTPVSETDLPDNAKSTVFVIIESPDGAAFASCEITDDQTPPAIELRRITVAGSVSDPTVTEVVVNGQAYPVTDGTYSFAIEAPVGSEIAIEATNAHGFKAVRTIRVTRQ